MLTKSEDLKYQLESLASYEPSDLDNPEFEVGYADKNDNEGFVTVCCIDVAKRALDKIKEVEQENSEVKALLKLIQARGNELLNIDGIEDREDAATIHSDFNDALLLISKSPHSITPK